MHLDIPSLIDTLRREGELVEIRTPVDTDLELAEVHRRVIAAGGPALLFVNPKGSEIPVVTNLFGTKRRVELAFGPRPGEFVQRAVSLLHELMPPTPSKLWAARDFFWQATGIGTKQVSSGPVTEVVDSPPRLDRLPMLRSWPEDGGSFVTLPLVYTEHPEDGRHNLGMYRIQRHNNSMTGMHWQIGKGGGFHHHLAQQRGEDLPVTVFVGGPPSLILAAIAPLPENVPELMLASLLAGQKLKMTKNPAGPHPLIANAEFAFVGRVPPTETHPEGPFGDHYGYYSLEHDYPVFHVDALCHKHEPIWPATIVGKPRQEDLFIGDYLQELLSPLFPVVMPNVKDLWSYGETGYHALASAVVKERFGREAMAAALRILGEGQLALTKFLLVVDQSVDLKDPKAVLTALLPRFRPQTDLYVLSNLSLDTLDYSGPEINKGSKGIMIGVGEPYRELPKTRPESLPPGCDDAVVYCPGVLLIQGPTYEQDPDWLANNIKHFSDWPLVCCVEDAKRAAQSDVRFLWTVFTRFEPAADIVACETRVVRHHLVYEGAIGIDSRMKPKYPSELFVDEKTSATVDRRWAEYFPRGDVEMGDADAAHLDVPPGS